MLTEDMLTYLVSNFEVTIHKHKQLSNFFVLNAKRTYYPDSLLVGMSEVKIDTFTADSVEGLIKYAYVNLYE